MRREDHFMMIVIEECAEVAHRVSKAARFGMDQIQEGKDDKPEDNLRLLTNRQRIEEEYYQLRASLGLIGIDAWDMGTRARKIESDKVNKVHIYLNRSKSLGRLED